MSALANESGLDLAVETSHPPRRRSRRMRETGLAFVMLVPAIVIFGVFIFYPFFKNFELGLYRPTVPQPAEHLCRLRADRRCARLTRVPRVGVDDGAVRAPDSPDRDLPRDRGRRSSRTRSSRASVCTERSSRRRLPRRSQLRR